MKYILLIILGLSISITTYGQLESGNVLLGGELSLGAGDNQIGFTFSPSGYYFISDNLAIGASIGFGTSRTNPGEDNYTRFNSIIISPSIRYFWNLSDKAYVYGSGSIGYSTFDSKSYVGNTSTNNISMTSFGIGIGTGILYVISPRISIDLGMNLVSFSRISSTTPTGGGPEETESSNAFRFGLDTFSPSFGLYYIIK